jgi:hypothetical protein
VGNTKYIAFAGDIYRGEEEFFTEQALLVIAHGDHVGVKVLHCYLHWDGERDADTSDAYVIGHLTSHSMSGFAVVDHIAAHMKDGHIHSTDVDWADSWWRIVQNRKVIDTRRMVFTSGLFIPLLTHGGRAGQHGRGIDKFELVPKGSTEPAQPSPTGNDPTTGPVSEGSESPNNST